MLQRKSHSVLSFNILQLFLSIVLYSLSLMKGAFVASMQVQTVSPSVTHHQVADPKLVQ